MTVKTLGDTHLGKAFHNGVPLHRRGDREAMQWVSFLESLVDVEDGDTHIQMGDLFDKAIVPYNVIFKAAQSYRLAAGVSPKALYVILIGNHDASRDLERVSAFRLFKEMVRDIPNVVVVDDQPHVVFADDLTKHVITPWHPVLTAKEMVEQHAGLIKNADAVYGHWDVVMGGDNQIPSAELKALGVKKAFTGHDHLRREMKLDGLDIQVVGSMQPYSHAEDPDELIYVTRELSDVLADPDAFKNKALRVVLKADEVLDIPIDCLQLQVQRMRADDTDIGEVQFEAFDLNALFEKAVAEVGLTTDLAARSLEKLEEERARS